MTTYRQVAALMFDLPRVVRQTRRERGLSQYDLARLTGISNVTICEFEKGDHRSHSNTVYRLLLWLGDGPVQWGEGRSATDADPEYL